MDNVIYLSDRRRKEEPINGKDAFADGIKELAKDSALQLAAAYKTEEELLPPLDEKSLSEWIARFERGKIDIEDGCELFEFLIAAGKIKGMDPSYKLVAETLIKMNMIYVKGLSEDTELIKENQKERSRRIDIAILFHSMILY